MKAKKKMIKSSMPKPKEKDDFTPEEKKVLWELAHKCAGVPPGGKQGRWTHEDRAAIVYAVMCALIRINKKKS